MNMYFKVRCVMYYSSLLTVIFFVFLLNTNEKMDGLEEEIVLSDSGEPLVAGVHRIVTKSMADRGKMDETNRYFLFLNNVPNCGGEFLVLLMQKLQSYNGFRHVRMGKGPKVLSEMEQEKLIENMYEKLKNDAIPLSFDKSIHFVNFTSHDRQSPTYINIIRDPIEKLHSRSQFGRESSLLKCIHMQRKCMIGDEIYEFNIPYFCGQDARCRSGNSEWALQTAKHNVERFYSVVGVLEDLNKTISALEKQLPFFFRGATNLYREKLSSVILSKHSLRMDPVRKNLLKSVLKTEYDFYDWITKRLSKSIEK